LLPLHEGACESEATKWNAPSLSKSRLHHKAKCRRFKDFPIATAIGHHGATCQGRTDPSKPKDLLSIPEVFSLDALDLLILQHAVAAACWR
jgi:hypothetical protein